MCFSISEGSIPLYCSSSCRPAGVRLLPILDWNHGRLLDRETSVPGLAAVLVLAILSFRQQMLYELIELEDRLEGAGVVNGGMEKGRG